MELNDSITVSTEGFMDLTIEKVAENRLSVVHYWKRRGDLMRDPEVVFNTKDSWMPVRYRQDPQFAQVDEDGLEIQDFLTTWSQNLQAQGFVDAAEEQYAADTP
jgi:hypothetical protein